MSLQHVTFTIAKDESIVRICSTSNSPFLNGVDELFLVITGPTADEYLISHFENNGKIVEKRRISEQELRKLIFVNGNRQIAQWILLGEIMADPTNRIESIRAEMKNQSTITHKKRIYLEFAGFVRRYMEAKEFVHNGHLLDSFNSILQSLQHWARVAILEKGEHPETTVWEQIKEIDPSVYKLYEELVTSPEPLEKRIELLLLALDFTVLSKMEHCISFIIDILKTRDTPWAVAEILEHPWVDDPGFDVLLLSKMVKRSLIKEHLLSRDGILEKCYSLS